MALNTSLWGGYAVIFHAQPRATKDIDFFMRADPANAQATYAALAQSGVPLQNIRPEDFADRRSFFRFGHDPRGVDILPDIPGVDFDAAWERRVEGVIDAKSGLKAFFISKDDLIAAKLASGRNLWHQSGRFSTGQVGDLPTLGFQGCPPHNTNSRGQPTSETGPALQLRRTQPRGPRRVGDSHSRHIPW
jgi:hypothetical protein